jgi:cytoskeleton protein RodZ
MSDSANTTHAPNPEADSGTDISGLGLGDRLRSARAARALSLEQVSEALHLDESIVLALEAEQFGVLGAPVFVRGHLKAYARLVKLSEASVLEAYDATHPQAEVLPGPREPDRSVTINPMVWGFRALVIGVAMVLGFYVLLGGDDGAVEPSAPPAIAESVSEPDSSPVKEQSGRTFINVIEKETSAVNVGEPGTAISPADEAVQIAQTQTVIAPDPTPDLADVARPDRMSSLEPEAIEVVRLRLIFRQESWVEISDVNRRLLFGLQREGRREISGELPFVLLLGNARGIDLQINDKPFMIPGGQVRGNVARFEITRDTFE